MIKNFKIISKKENSKDVPVAFHSCNFDTFIRKINFYGKNYIYVATCNNVQWELYNANGLFPRKNDMSDKYHTSDSLIHGRDVYEGLLDDIYINGNEFYVIDDKKIKKIKVGNNHCLKLIIQL